MKIHNGAFISTLIFLALSLSGCVSQTMVNHSFEFNAKRESPDIEILNYCYGLLESHRACQGTLDSHGIGVNDETLKSGIIPQQTSNTGNLFRGDFLYVKWRIKATGEILEDTVDLRDRLPRDIKDHRIHFVVKGKQLYVYLVSQKPNKNRFAKPPLKMYSDLQVDEIYPAQPKF